MRSATVADAGLRRSSGASPGGEGKAVTWPTRADAMPNSRGRFLQMTTASVAICVSRTRDVWWRVSWRAKPLARRFINRCNASERRKTSLPSTYAMNCSKYRWLQVRQMTAVSRPPSAWECRSRKDAALVAGGSQPTLSAAMATCGLRRFAQRRSASRTSSIFLANYSLSRTSSTERVGCRWL